MVILNGFPLLFLHFIHLSALLYWGQDLIVLDSKLLVIIISILTVSSISLLTCRTSFRLLASKFQFDLENCKGNITCYLLSSYFLFYYSFFLILYFSYCLTLSRPLHVRGFIALMKLKRLKNIIRSINIRSECIIVNYNIDSLLFICY